MRQAGMMAAAGLYALDHNVERLREDHNNARRLAQKIAQHPNIDLDPLAIQTNIVLFDLVGTDVSAVQLVELLEQKGINLGAFAAQRLRAVTHLDVSTANIDKAANAILQAVDKLTA